MTCSKVHREMNDIVNLQAGPVVMMLSTYKSHCLISSPDFQILKKYLRLKS